MQDKPQNIDKLFQKHQHQFDKMPSDNAWNRLENMLDQTDSATAEAKKAQAEPQSLKTIVKPIETAEKPSRPMWRYAVAAMLLLTLLSIGGYLTNQLSNGSFIAEKTMQSGSKNVAANAVQKSKSQEKAYKKDSEEIKNEAKSVGNKAVKNKEVNFKETAKTSATLPPPPPPPAIEEVEDEVTETPQYLSEADAKDTDIPSPVVKEVITEEIVEEEPIMVTEDEESDDFGAKKEEIAETEIAFEEVVEEIVEEEEKILVEDSINIGATSTVGATGTTNPTGATGVEAITPTSTRSAEDATEEIPQDVIELKSEEGYNLDNVSVLNEAQGMSKKARKAKRNKDKKAKSAGKASSNPYMDNSGNAFNSTVLQWDWLAGDWTSADGDKELNVMPSSQAGLKINEFSSQNGDAVLARVLDIQETANGVTLRIQYLAQEYKNQAAIAFFNEESQANNNKLQFVDDSGTETKTIRVEQVDNQTIKWEEINGDDIKTILFQKR